MCMCMCVCVWVCVCVCMCVGVTWGSIESAPSGWSEALDYVDEHGNDLFMYRAVEPESRIAVLWHFSRFAN